MGQTVKVYVSVKCGAWEGEAVLFPPECGRAQRKGIKERLL